MKKIYVTLLFLLISFSVCLAQGAITVPVHPQVGATEGNTSVLKGRTIKVIFVNDGMNVGEMSEKDYISAKVTTYNTKKAGSGDAWLKEWIGNRKDFFEPSFISKFNEMGKKTHTIAEANADSGSAFTLIVTTTFTEPGFNAGMIENPARINATCAFKDAGGNTIFKIDLNNIPGRTFGGQDFDTASRLTECYAKLAKDLFKAIQKQF